MSLSPNKTFYSYRYTSYLHVALFKGDAVISEGLLFLLLYMLLYVTDVWSFKRDSEDTLYILIISKYRVIPSQQFIYSYVGTHDTRSELRIHIDLVSHTNNVV